MNLSAQATVQTCPTGLPAVCRTVVEHAVLLEASYPMTRVYTSLQGHVEDLHRLRLRSSPV
jgi:hypothetical protein